LNARAGNDGRTWAHPHVMRDVMIVPVSAPRSSPGRHSKALAGPRPLDGRQTGIGRGEACNSVQPAARDRAESCRRRAQTL